MSRKLTWIPAGSLKVGDLVEDHLYPVELQVVRSCSQGCCRLLIWGDGESEWHSLPATAQVAVLEKADVPVWTPEGDA